MAFVDAGFLREQGKRVLKLEGRVEIDGMQLWRWLSHAWVDQNGSRFQRAYIYDGAFAPDHQEYERQQKYFHDLATQPDMRLRRGHVVIRGGRPDQKGVDTLLVLDLVRLAQARAYDTALIVAGDQDFTEAVRVIADDHARRVVLYTPDASGVANELMEVVDQHGWIDEPFLRGILTVPEE